MEGPFRDPELKLVETLGWNGAAYVRLDRHMARLEASARALGFPFDAARHVPQEQAFGTALRCRLTLDRLGSTSLAIAPLPPAADRWSLALSSETIRSDDPRLAHKTTDRALYDRTRATLPAGVDEVIFANERGEIAEGTITTVFFDLGHGLMTPPLASGCLPGCLRAELLEQGRAREAVLRVADLAGARIWVGNSLRGLIAGAMR